MIKMQTSRKSKAVLAFLILFLPQLVSNVFGQETCRNIIGYYPSWQMYKRGGLIKPENVDYSKYTILMYSFFAPDTNATLWGTDAWADTILLRGNIDWGKGETFYYPNTSIIDQAHVWGTKVIPSIGGWSLSDNFPKIAADPNKRARFASQCVALLKNFNFDGIDIDWEYPGYEEHHGTPQDKQNYTLFMKAIRDSIDAYGKTINYKFLLTAAYGANLSQMENIEWDKCNEFMDFFNMMTYDFNGTWSSETNHNSPLYNPSKGTQASMDECFRLLTEKYGVPSNKINMGVAWYGRTFVTKDKPELYGPHVGKVDDKTFAVDEGSPQYFNILYQMNKFEKKWDDKAQVPYLIGKNLNTFVSYDDEESIKLKAEYVVKNNMAGVIIWDATGDYVETAPGSGRIKSTPLVNKLNEVLKPCPTKKIKKRWN